MNTKGKYIVAFTAALGLVMAVLDNTIVNVALVPMAEAFKTDLNTIQWVVTGYFLAQAAVIAISGYFSTRFGIKRLFIICLALFTAGSVLCGLAQSESSLIACRVLQGLGGGALFPLSQAISFGAFPPNERAKASAVVGVPVLLAPTFGPTMGGWLMVNYGWPSIFFVNLPVGILAIALAWLVLPADQVREKREDRSFDYAGLALVTLGVLAVVYAFSLVSQVQPGTSTIENPAGNLYGWGYWLVWVLLGVGLVLLAAFAVYELRFSKDPVLDLHLFKRSEYTMASVVSWVNGSVVFGSMFLLPVFFQQIRIPNLSALDTGMALIPQGVASAIAVAASGWLYSRVGVRWLVSAGALLLALSSYQLSLITNTSDGWTLMPALFIRGLGFGFTLIPVQTLALQSIEAHALPKASSLFNVTRQIFGSVGVAGTITFFVQQSVMHGTQLAGQLRSTLPAGARPDLNNPLVQAAMTRLRSEAGTEALRDVFFYVMIGTVLLAFVSLLLPGRAAQAKPSAAAASAHRDGAPGRGRAFSTE
ncbi:MAG: multidrug efflux MFS transporter [Chloroflexota bacterium]|nr:multidrug efflux MFS transporter [Chloroflexota bacterium]